MSISLNMWHWVMGLGMIAIFSFLYKENPFYRLVEHIYVGSGAGYAISLNYGNIYDRAWVPLTQQGEYKFLIPIVLGFLLYTRFFKPVAWLSRWSMSFLVGIGTGMALYGVTNSQLIAQVRSSMIPLVVRTNGVFSLSSSLNNAIMVFGVISILLYFFFSVEQKGAIKGGAAFGRWIMMITFGVSFGNVVMGRISLLLGALEDVLGTWLGIV